MSQVTKIYLYFTVFLIGATTLVVEILGTRTLGPFYGSTVFVWSSLISVTMLGLALGYMISGVIADRWPNLRFLYIYVASLGVLLLLVPKLQYSVLLMTDRFGMRFGPLVAAAILYLLIFIICGLVAPLAVKLLLKDTSQTGHIAGRIYALGTAGSLFGGLLAGFYLLPLVAISKLFMYLGLAMIGWAGVGFLLIGSKNFKNKFFIGLILIILFGTTLMFSQKENSVFAYHAQSFYGDIKIGKSGPMDCLFVNGLTQTCLTAKRTTDALYIQQIKKIVDEKQPQNILLIGLAGGSVLTVLPDDISITAVELDPEVVRVSKEFGIFPEKNVNIIYDDGRHFLETSREKFDLIIIDVALGSSLPPFMFTVEAFGAMQARLDNDGILFLNTMLLDPVADKDLFGSVVASFNQVFSGNAWAWQYYPGENQFFNLVAGSVGSWDYLVDLSSYLSYTQAKPVYDDKISVYFRHQSFLESLRQQLIQTNPKLLLTN